MYDFIGRERELEVAAGALDTSDSLVLTGPSGVGKTRLLRELVGRCRTSGWNIVDLSTTPATSSISLWPFQQFLPEAPPGDIQGLAFDVRQHFLDAGGEQRVLIAIDDMQHLDRASVGMLGYLLETEHVFLAGALRDTDPRPDGLDELLNRLDAERLGVEPFDRDDGAVFLEQLLVGPCSPALVDMVTDIAQGNPLLMREVVLDGLDEGLVQRVDDVWSLTDPERGLLETIGDRTRICVERRIARMTDDEKRTLQLVAVAGSVHPSIVPPELGASLEVLERRRLLALTTDGPGGWEVRFDHPVVGEVVVRTMPGSTRLAVTRQLIERVRATESALPGDSTRLALWAEETGDDLGVDEWLAATEEAVSSFDPETAERWAGRALALDPTSHAAHRTLGRVLRHRGQVVAAAASFAAAERYATTDAEIAHAAIDRAGLVGLPLRDLEGAVALLLEAASRVSDPAHALAMRSEAGVLATLLGRFEDVLLAQPTDEQLRTADDSTRWLLGLNEVYARSMLGRVAGIADVVNSTLRYYPAVAGERPQELDFVLGLRGAARIQRGEFAQGIDELWTGVQERRNAGEYRGIMSLVLTLLMELVNDPRGPDVAADGVAQHEWFDPVGSAPIAIAAASLVAASRGDIAGAEALARSGVGSGSEPWTSIWIGRALARVAYLKGDRDSAIDQCVAAGQAALDTSHYVYASLTFHDLVLYGDSRSAADLLGVAVAPTEGCLFLELLERHAAAAAAENPDRLWSCAAEFARLAAHNLTAVASYQCATAALAHDQVVARRAEAFGRSAADRLRDGPRPTPPLVPDSVTDRERQLGMQAAGMESSRAIAERLGISSRTVDNHLRRVYHKLGLSGREELAAYFDLDRAARGDAQHEYTGSLIE